MSVYCIHNSEDPQQMSEAIGCLREMVGKIEKGARWSIEMGTT